MSVLSRVSVCLLVLALPNQQVTAGCSRCYKAPVVKQVRYVEQQVLQPIVQNVYYTVGAQVRDYYTAPQHVAAAEMGQLERQIERLQGQLQEYKAMQQQPQQYYAPPQQQVQCQGQTQCQGQGPTTFSQMAPTVTQQHCLKCHSGTNAKAGLRFDQGPLSMEQKLKVWHQAASGEMPKDGDELTDDELARLVEEHFTEGEWAAMQRLMDRRREEQPEQLEQSQQQSGELPPPQQ